VAVVFILSAMLFGKHLPIEADETLIGNGIYARGAPVYSWTIGNSELPIMMLSYVGALKTWLLNGVFELWKPGPVSLRLPMVLVAGFALWPLFVFLDRSVGRRAAWIGTLLLATDPSWVLLTSIDFGFIVGQFFFKMGALLLLLRFHRDGKWWALAGAFFLLGVALWDKAVFLWVLFGLGVAGFAIFPAEIRGRLAARNLGIATASMILGALPLVIYNVARPLETLRSNAKVSDERIAVKAHLVRRTLEGAILFGFFTAADPGPHPGEPARWYQTASVKINQIVRAPRQTLTIPALLLALLALPWLWRTDARRPILFGLVAFVATWIPMALTSHAGGAAHHIILLWPFHLLIIAVVLARMPARFAAAAVVLICAANLLVTNHYYADLIRNGGALQFSDAIYPLNQKLAGLRARRIFVMDWGIIETINLLSEGRTPVIAGEPGDQAYKRRMFTDPRHAFVAHTRGNEIVHGLREDLEEAAREDHYGEENIDTIYDRNGRAIFDVFRFHKVAPE